MTTIAWDGTTLASDSQGSGSFIYENGPKVFEHNGCLYGIAGDREAVEQAVRWIKASNLDPSSGEPPNLQTENVGGLMINPQGECFVFEKRLIPFEVSTPHAEGSGQRFAMGAMLAGATAEDAVRIAIELDQESGGTVHKVSRNDLEFRALRKAMME
ncbi:MAG: hypothetical protein AAFR65_11095 [Pseudomonadota bacterium]